MASDDEIVQKIRIEAEGGDAAAKEYKKVGDAAEATSKKIEKAGEAGGEGLEKAGESAKSAADGFEQASKAAKTLGEGFDSFGKAAEKVGQGFDGLAQAGETAGAALGTLTKSGDQISSSLEDIGKSVDGLGTSLEGVGKASEGFEQVTSSISKLGSTSEEALSGARRAAEEFGASAFDLGRVEGMIAELASQASASGESFKTMAERFDDVRSSLSDGGAEARKTAEELSRLGKVATEALTEAAKSGQDFSDALKQLQEFEGALTKLADGADKSGESFKGMAAGADEASESTEKASGALENANTAATVLSGALDGLNYHQARVARLAAEAAAATEKAGVAVAQVSAAAAQAGVGLAQTAGGMAQAGAAAATAASGIAQTAAATTQLGAAATATGGVLASIRAAFASAAASATAFAASIDLSRQNLRAFSAVGRALSIPLPTGLISTLTRIGNILGPGGVIAVGAAITTAALIKLGESALKAQKDIERMAAGMGTSFAQMKAAEDAFGKLGVSAKQFGEITAAAMERIITKGPQLAHAMADSADKTASALEKIAESRMKAAEATALVRGGDEAAKAVRESNERQRALIAEGAAYRTLGADIRAGVAAVANDLPGVVAKVQQLAAGFKGIKFDKGTEISTILSAVDQVLGQVTASGGNFYESLTKIIQQAPRLEAIEIGKAFKIPQGAIEQIQKGTKSVSEFFDELKQGEEASFKPDLTGIKALNYAFELLKKAWSDLMTTFGESNLAGLLASSLGGVLVIITGLVKGFDWLIGIIDKAITGLRLLAGVVASTVGQKIFGMSAEDAEKLKLAIGGVSDASKKAGGDLSRTSEAADELKRRMAGLAQATPNFGFSAQQLRQMWQDGIIGLLEYQRRLNELRGVKLPTYGQLRQEWQDGIIGLQEYKTRLNELWAVKPPTFEELRTMWRDHILNLTQYKEKLVQLGNVKPTPIADPLIDASKGADQYSQKITDVTNKLDKPQPAPKTDWDNAVKGAEGAATTIRASFAGALKVLGEAAKDAAKSIGDAFSEIKPRPIDWSELVNGSANAAKDVEKVFKDLSLPDLKLNFDPMIEAAQQAAAQIQGLFNSIGITGVTFDYSGVIAAAQAAGLQIAQTIQTLVSTANLSGLVVAAETAFTAMRTAATELFNALVAAAQETVRGISAAFAQVDLGGLINQVNTATQAFKDMAAAANDAASAASSASSASSSSPGGLATGGLFRGRPGRDTNLAWLTDYEFVMRPEAVLKYGVDFMRMINALAFPSGGFRDGGLVMPRLSIPAFANGGLNAGGGSRGGSQNMRPLNLTIGGETFRGLFAPEDTARALERAAISRQTSSTGTRPRWNK